MERLRRLFEHAAWADERCLVALRRCARVPEDVLGDFGHVLGAEHVWLARLRGEPPAVAVWPAADLEELARLAEHSRVEWAAYLDGLAPEELAREVAYVNSDGVAFESRVDDVLLHVALHGAYHRGQIMRALRVAGEETEATDYIAFVRGAPAARRS